jgi:hypothetical protein
MPGVAQIRSGVLSVNRSDAVAEISCERGWSPASKIAKAIKHEIPIAI